MEEKQPKIMTKPLPAILDELDDSIRLANEATKDARQAAEEARRAGEKAANEARRAAEIAVAKVRDEATKAINALGVRASTLETELSTLKGNVAQEALSLDKAFVALKDKHMEVSPFLKK
jgi:Cdc6-like AAA superfamily ATPase